MPALAPVDDLEALREARAGYVAAAERFGGPPEEVARVQDVAIARPDGTTLGARAYWPAEEAVGAFLWLHGGGWYIGDLDGFDRVARSLCNAAGAVVLSVDYRLAPEHRFPAARRGRRPGRRVGGGRGRRRCSATCPTVSCSAATARAATSPRSPPATARAPCARSCSSIP